MSEQLMDPDVANDLMGVFSGSILAARKFRFGSMHASCTLPLKIMGSVHIMEIRSAYFRRI